MSVERVERRYLKGLELRQSEDGKPVIDGYAAVFNSLSQELWGFREMIMPGAFNDALKDPAIDVKALFNHDDNMVLGRLFPMKGVSTCRLNEDERGLHAEIDPPDTSAGRDVVKMLERGDVDSMSFAFIADEEEWQWRGTSDGLPLRMIKKCQLFDVSVVTYPAYPATTVGVRKIYGAVPDITSEEFRSRHPKDIESPDAVRAIRLKKRELTLKTRHVI